ncbi:MAG: hypothetical protein ACT4OO_14500 [Nitrospiraceae bacterium]
MKVKLAFALLSLMLLGSPIYAQSLCLQCINAAKEELKKCLAAAISQEDKMSCAEKQEARAQACENGACEIERAQKGNKGEVLPEKK